MRNAKQPLHTRGRRLIHMQPWGMHARVFVQPQTTHSGDLRARGDRFTIAVP